MWSEMMKKNYVEAKQKMKGKIKAFFWSKKVLFQFWLT